MKKDTLEVLKEESDRLHKRLDDIDSIKRRLSELSKPENAMYIYKHQFQVNVNSSILQAFHSYFGELPTVLFNLLCTINLEDYFNVYEDDKYIVIELKDEQ